MQYPADTWDVDLDSFFDRLGEFLRSTLKKEEYDPDMQSAWDELDEYLKTGKNRISDKQKYKHFRTTRPADPLLQDYANLEVPFGTSFEEVKHSYKTLLRKYHPDRFGMDPDKQELATKITQKINESFQRIKKINGEKRHTREN